MSYSLKADIQKEISDAELIGLTDDAGAGAIDDAIIAAAIAKADALIDSYCGQVETVPFTTVPDIVAQHSVTIAIYFLYSRRSAIPEARAQNYKDAIAHLKDIATGKAALPVSGETTGDDAIRTDRTSDDRKHTLGKDSDSSTGTLDNY
jgi:phage gp36-like protein